MADDRRTAILLAIETRLLTLAEISTVMLGALELIKKARPGVGILPVSDTKERASKLHKTRDLKVTLRVLVDQGAERALVELDAILLLVSRTMASDPTFGGLVNDFFEDETRWLFGDDGYPQAGADIDFRFHYEI